MLNEQASGADPVYVHKPSLMGAAWQLCLRPDALEWQRGRYSGRIPYAGITRVRLSFRPASMQTRRFVTEIWWTGGRRLSIPSTSRRLPVEWYPQDRAYGAFIRELNRRIAAVGGPAAVVTGVPAFLYLPGLALFAAMALAIAALTVRALEIGDDAGAALLGGLFALFVWQSGIFFKRNRPGRYRPEAVPNDLVQQ